jgi:hypothetical protein
VVVQPFIGIRNSSIFYHGHCKVPHNYTSSIALSQWVKRQRYQWKRKTEGKYATMTNAHKKALMQLGFIWESQDAIWDQRFEELCNFKRCYGDKEENI